MVMLLCSHAVDPGSIPAERIFFFLNLYTFFYYFVCAIFGGVMALLIFQCQTVLHLDARVCRLLKLFVFWDRMWNSIVSVGDHYRFIYFVTSREHTVYPPVIIFEENSLIREKQLFTLAHNISRVSYFVVFITSKKLNRKDDNAVILPACMRI